MITAHTLGILLLFGFGPAGWCYAWYHDRMRHRDIDTLRSLLQQAGDGKALPSPAQKTPPEIRALQRELTQLLALCAGQAQKHAAVLRQFRSQLDIQKSLQELLRRKIKSDSPLLRELDDYSLLQEACADTALPKGKLFDLSMVLAKALAEARGILPPGRKLHISAELAAESAAQWHGQPELLHALFKHLLLIAFRRTSSGVVQLRLSAEPMQYDESHSMLRIRLSDNGPFMQRWQLRHWLKPDRDTGPAGLTETEISWMLVARLLHRLTGGSTAESSTAGLELAAWLPLRNTAPFCAVGGFTAGKPNINEDGPLIFAVEHDRIVQKELRGLCEAEGCRLFLLSDHTQALHWLATLPLRAVLLNTAAADSWLSAMMRIDLQIQQGTTEPLDMGLITDVAPPHSLMLEASGKLQLLRKPLQAEDIAALCRKLTLERAPFYRQCDEAMLKDMSPQLTARLPAIVEEFADQVQTLLSLIAAAGKQEPCSGLAQQAHMVKSGALTLGYFRLAALASEIEHSAQAESFAGLAENWLAIAACIAQEWRA